MYVKSNNTYLHARLGLDEFLNCFQIQNFAKLYLKDLSQLASPELEYIKNRPRVSEPFFSSTSAGINRGYLALVSIAGTVQ
jgi:hypothetical protein